MAAPSRIVQLFERGNGIVDVRTLLENGISYHDINGMLADGAIVG
jgi:hypothetical protein